MSTRKFIAAATAVALFTSVSAFAAKTTQQKCGSAIGKAVSALENSISKEAARACRAPNFDKGQTVSGKVNNGKPADEGRLGSATKKFNRARTRAYERYSLDETANTADDLDNCPDVNEVIAQSVFDETDARAVDLCTSGTSIPLPTDP
jgi:hypothetical protein